MVWGLTSLLCQRYKNFADLVQPSNSVIQLRLEVTVEAKTDKAM
jgi:hypothetical protein